MHANDRIGMTYVRNDRELEERSRLTISLPEGVFNSGVILEADALNP